VSQSIKTSPTGSFSFSQLAFVFARHVSLKLGQMLRNNEHPPRLCTECDCIACIAMLAREWYQLSTMSCLHSTLIEKHSTTTLVLTSGQIKRAIIQVSTFRSTGAGFVFRPPSVVSARFQLVGPKGG